MKSLLLLSIFACFFFPETLSRKVLIKTIHLEAKTQTQIELDINAPIEIIEWKGNTIRVFTEIQLVAQSDKILKHLISKGRYHIPIEQLDEGDKLKLKMPNLAKKIIINGQVVREQVSVKVMIPASVTATLSKSAKANQQVVSNK